MKPRDAHNRVMMIDANIWGLLFYGAELEIEFGPNQIRLVKEAIRGVHLYRFIGLLLVFTEHARQVISRLGYEGPLTVDVTLSGILGVQWLYSQDGMGMYQGPISELDDGFSFSLPTGTDVLQQRRDSIVRSMLQSILFGMNWADYASDAGNLEKLLRDGYGYNFWNKTAALQF